MPEFGNPRITDAWRAAISFTQIIVPFGDIHFKIQHGEPRGLISFWREVDFSKPETLVLFTMGTITQMDGSVLYSQLLTQMEQKEKAKRR